MLLPFLLFQDLNLLDTGNKTKQSSNLKLNLINLIISLSNVYLFLGVDEVEL